MIGFVLAAVSALGIAATIGWRLLTQSKAYKLTPHVLAGLPEQDWNIVRVSVCLVREMYPSAKTGEIFPVRIAIGLRTRPARLRASSMAKTTIDLSERMKEELGWSKGGQDVAEDAREVRFLRPVLRLDLRTINHPDPDIRLQWRMAVLFLVLGWLPTAVMSYLNF